VSRNASAGGLGPALRRAWVGYQQRLDEGMAEAGFGDRRFPDGRVLRMCRDGDGTTISQIGRELGISRQGSGKIVAELVERGFVVVTPSATNGREKVVSLTARAHEYLAAHRKVARSIERRLRADLGGDAFAGLERLLESLGGNEDIRMRDYLRRMGVREV
jgi:DNA-binding MarR family transcriptional regulator